MPESITKSAKNAKKKEDNNELNKKNCIFLRAVFLRRRSMTKDCKLRMLWPIAVEKTDLVERLGEGESEK